MALKHPLLDPLLDKFQAQGREMAILKRNKTPSESDKIRLEQLSQLQETLDQEVADLAEELRTKQANEKHLAENKQLAEEYAGVDLNTLNKQADEAFQAFLQARDRLRKLRIVLQQRRHEARLQRKLRQMSSREREELRQVLNAEATLQTAKVVSPDVEQ